MATQAPAQLPLFYKNLIPLQSGVHNGFHTRSSDRAPFFASTHAVPITVDEFLFAQRQYPIVFSAGDNPVPLGLFGLNEGVNVFMDEEGKPRQEMYIPAYVRRYPWMLAKLNPEAAELSLCFDPESGLVGEFDEGQALFDGDKPNEVTNAVLKFCEDFEISAQRTTAFVNELKEHDLLMEGEVSIQIAEGQPPYIYRGFRMVNEQKFRDLRGDALRKLNQNGALPLIMAHLFSLSLVQTLFARQLEEGRLPNQPPIAAS